MNTATVTGHVLKKENTSSSANVLMCKQWWKVCWMYGGNQEKYYRQLYGKKVNSVPDFARRYGADNPNVPCPVTADNRTYENTNVDGKTGSNLSEGNFNSASVFMPLGSVDWTSIGDNLDLQFNDSDE